MAGVVYELTYYDITKDEVYSVKMDVDFQTGGGANHENIIKATQKNAQQKMADYLFGHGNKDWEFVEWRVLVDGHEAHKSDILVTEVKSKYAKKDLPQT